MKKRKNEWISFTQHLIISTHKPLHTLAYIHFSDIEAWPISTGYYEWFLARNNFSKCKVAHFHTKAKIKALIDLFILFKTTFQPVFKNPVWFRLTEAKPTRSRFMTFSCFSNELPENVCIWRELRIADQ